MKTRSSATSANAIRRLIRSAGVKLIFLPKYLPDLNPIKQVFAKAPASDTHSPIELNNAGIRFWRNGD
jgi:transposase